MAEERESPAEALSETERQILSQLATGATNREIARARGISEATVKKHVTSINWKLGTGNRTEAVRRALELGLVTVDTPSLPHASGHADLARHLAEELARTRRSSARTVRWAILVASLVVTVAVAAVFATYAGAWPPRAAPEPTPRATAGEAGLVWVAAVSLPSPRAGLALVSESGTVMAIAGSGDSGPLSDVLQFDAAGLRWERRAPKPTSVRDASAAAVQGKLIVPGGCDESGRAVDAVEIYDPRADTWSSGAPMPEPACGYALVALQGQVYLFGGRSGSAAASGSNRTWRYDPAADRWSAMDPMPLARCDLAAVALSATSVHVIGGRGPDGQPQASHWAFEPFAAGGQWNTEGGPPLPEGRAGLAAAAISSRIYLVGGGWDRRLVHGSLMWDSAEPARAWQPFAEVRGATPQRGAGLVADGDQFLHLAGGEADGRLLDTYQTIQVAWRLLLPPAP